MEGRKENGKRGKREIDVRGKRGKERILYRGKRGRKERREEINEIKEI